MNESNLAINGLSKDELDNTQTFSMSASDEFIVVSAQAFMQGLYPPLNISLGTLLNLMSILANGSIIGFPLDGYQYPHIYTASPLEPILSMSLAPPIVRCMTMLQWSTVH
jgi:hypothetical protein